MRTRFRAVCLIVALGMSQIGIDPFVQDVLKGFVLVIAITIDVLNRIDLNRVAKHVNKTSEARTFLSDAAVFEDKQQLLVFEKKAVYGAKTSTARRTPRLRRPPPPAP